MSGRGAAPARTGGGFSLVEVVIALGLLALPMAIRPVLVVFRETSGPVLITALKGTARVNALAGAFIAIGAAL